jgi:hypothetical protein
MRFLGTASYHWQHVPYRRYFKSIVVRMGPIKTPSAACSRGILQLGKGGKAHADRCIENLIFLPTPHVLPYLCPQEPIIKRRGRLQASRPIRDIPRRKYQKMHKLSPHRANCATLPSSHANFVIRKNVSLLSPTRSPSAFPFWDEKKCKLRERWHIL